MRRSFPITLVILSAILEPQAAHAYLDPGTGSMLLSVFVGLISGAYFMLRKLPSTLRGLFFRITGKTDALKHNTLTFYAESAAYWSTFKPILKALETLGVHSSYLTSDPNDPVFSSGLQCVHARFIGKSNAAYTALGFLETKVFVLTTPGIDVLQIRRSPGVGRYVHVVHSVGDIHTYKLYSFDYYDAVYCSGPGQVSSLRKLEQLRGTRPKELLQLGCAYLDGLVGRAKTAGALQEATVIVAPTWGRNGLLMRTGSMIPKMLAQAGYHVILRPHPQSFVSEPDLMQKLADELKEFKNIEWDRQPDGFASLSRARIMVSDISGVIFDFAFVFLRPVVSVGNGPLKEGFEAWDIPHEAWEMSTLESLGRRVLPGHEDTIVEIVRSLLADSETAREKILALRECNVVNFGEAGMPIARALIEEVKRVESCSTCTAQNSRER